MDLSKIEKLYSDNARKFGIDSRSVAWRTPESQELRFSKLLEVVANRQEPFSVNELGCGYGELYKYMRRNGFSVRKFYGYDISEKMLENAREYIGGDEAVELFRLDHLDRAADYAITSGIFNVRFDVQAGLWTDYIREMLR